MNSRGLCFAPEAFLVVALAIAGASWATPGSGVVVTERVVSSAADIESSIIQGGDSGQLQLHQKIGGGKSLVNVTTATQTFAPGGSSGWHSHPGPGWVVIVSGTASMEETQGCFVDYPAGSVIFEAGPSDIHNLHNRSGTDAMVLRTWFFSPVGVPGRIDQQPMIGECE